LGTADACRTKAADPRKEPHDDGSFVTLGAKAVAAAQLELGRPRSVIRRVSVSCSGKIDFVPSRVARIGPPVAGRVSQIPVALGQKVGRGAVLVTLESVEVGRARAEYSAAKTRVDQSKAEIEREKRLLLGGATSERAVLLAQTEQAQALVALRSAEDRLATLGLGAGAAGQNVSLVAPLAGTVLQISARLGQPVGPSDTVVVVGETELVWLTVDVYERDLGKVHVGDDVRVTSVAFPGRTFDGKVDALGAVVDPERHVLEARIVLTNDDGALRPGMSATARISGSLVADSGTMLVVARRAIQTIDGQAFVFVEHAGISGAEGGPLSPSSTTGARKFELRPVERGLELDDDVEITRGLTLDDTVVEGGGFILKSEALKGQMGAND
jgi:cobalt-zinc-cadmium efflux system membrane fusion protein